MSSEPATLEELRGDEEQDQQTLEVSASRGDLIEACKVNLDFLASLILTDIYKYGYPAALQTMWQMLCVAAGGLTGKPKYALGIPRGFSKTIWLKLYVVWLILFSDRRFILIVCNTASHANNFIADVQDMLDNPNIVSIFGNWRAGIEKDTQELKKFTFRGKKNIIAGIGSGGSVRGLNIKFVRPDIVLMDDMQNRDEAENAEVASSMMDWMLGTLMKACHPQRCVFVFVGNMYPFEGSILRKLKKSKEWISFITGAILANGESLWPEHRTIEDLLSELAFDTEQGRPHIFFSEVMNDEDGGTVSGIDVSKIPQLPAALEDAHAQGGMIIIDPSLGKKKSDDLAITAFLIYDGVPVARESVVGKFDPGQTIKESVILASKYNIGLIAVEAVAYQESLVFWFNFIFQQMGMSGIFVGTVTTGGLSKNSRILAMFKQLLSGKLMLHPTVRSAVIHQVTQFNPLITKNKDDVLDTLAYPYKVMELYPDSLPLILNADNSLDLPDASFGSDLELAF